MSDGDLTGNKDVDEPEADEEERSPRRGAAARPTTARRAQSEVRMERKLQGGLKQLGAIIGRRDETLGAIISEDAAKMGTMLAHASQAWPIPFKKLISVVVELLDPLDAFGRTAAHLLMTLRAKRAETNSDEWIAGEEQDEPRPQAQPWKLGSSE